MKKGFGDPKPLPGDAQYKMSQSQKLEKEAKEMEARLQGLHESTEKQNVEQFSNAAKWKSGASDRGSVGSYAKDLQEKHKKRSEQAAKATSNGRRTSRQDLAGCAEDTQARVEDWAVSHVLQWLAKLDLNQYKDSFAQNEITGQVLLELTLDDLDYMSITVLGHRKTILKGIEELRKQKLSAPAAKLQSALGPIRSSSASGVKAVEAAKDQKSEQKEAMVKTHWSQLEPLANQPVKGSVAHSVNAADEGDVFDEEAEKQAFMAAVAEWRSGGGEKVSIVRDYEPGGEKKSSESAMWHNPFPEKSAAVDDPATRSARQGRAEDASKARSKKLNEGILDEAAEHEEFLRAVEQWRSGGKAKSAGGATTKQSGQGNDTPIENASALQEVAAKLAAELDHELEDNAQRLRRQKEEAERKLQELSKLRSNKSLAVEDVEDKQPVQSPLRVPNLQVTRGMQFTDEDEDMLDEASSAEPSPRREDPLQASTVDIALIESTLGVHLQADDDNATANYIVEEQED